MAEDTLYESTYILATDLEEEEIEQITGRLRQMVEQAGAEFVADHLLGQRQLAYQIDDHSAGIYRVMYFKGSGEAVRELKNELLMNESIIRGIVVVANPDAIFHPTAHPEQVAELEEEQAASVAEEPEAVQEAEAAPMAEESVAETSEPEAEESSEASPEQPEAEATETELESDD